MTSGSKNITILGSTGSIGIQTLEVIETLKSEFSIGYLTVNTKIDLLEEQAFKYKPKGIAIGNESAFKNFKKSTSFKGKMLCGEQGICEAASDSENDLTFAAMVGFSGVRPALSAIEAGINVALANKETLVAAGQIVTEAAKKKNVQIIAVDSEHSAILQCLAGEDRNSVEKIILTASGGPFLNLPKNEFRNITVTQALDHPNWSMGKKITIDSATMMNKGFEVIEAHWLFGIEMDMIEVLIHPQSIIHSFVEFKDGSVKAQLGLHDMRIPISYALTYPERREYNFPRLDLSLIPHLNFFKPDFERFKCLSTAYKAIFAGGASTAILNAANEVAVQAFLHEKITFNEIPLIVEEALVKVKNIDSPVLGDIINIDSETRLFAKNFLQKR